MKISRNVNKPVCILVGLALVIVAAVVVYFDVAERLDWGDKSKIYKEANGKVIRIDEDEYTYRANDKTKRETVYAVVVEYSVDGQYYTVKSEYDMDSSVDRGDKFVVMYREQEPKVSYIAKEDWLTGVYIPYNVGSVAAYMTAFLLLGVAVMALGWCVDNAKVASSSWGIGLSMIGFGGAIFGVKAGYWGCGFLVLFGAIGLLILYKTWFTKERIVFENENRQIIDDTKKENKNLF